MKWFETCDSELQQARLFSEPPRDPIIATVLRGQVLETLCSAIQSHGDAKLLGGLEVHIDGENYHGDGVTHEVLSLLALELCYTDVGLFKVDPEGGMLHPSNQSGVKLDHLEYFALTGTLIGVALSSGGHLPVPLSSLLLKMFLDIELSIHDLKDVDAEVYRSLFCRLRSLIEEEIWSLESDFTYNDVFFGEMNIVNLLRVGGSPQRVTTQSEADIYLRLVAHQLMQGCVHQQIVALKRGLHALVPEMLLRTAGKLFSAEEFRQLIAGIAEIDSLVLDDWQEHTQYAVKAFWQSKLSGQFYEKRVSPEDRGALLRFVHGSPRAPARGFSSLLGCNGNIHRFSLVKAEAEVHNAYPRTQTCFNKLFLPTHTSTNKMECCLRIVLSSSAAGFDEGAMVG